MVFSSYTKQPPKIKLFSFNLFDTQGKRIKIGEHCSKLQEDIGETIRIFLFLIFMLSIVSAAAEDDA